MESLVGVVFGGAKKRVEAESSQVREANKLENVPAKVTLMYKETGLFPNLPVVGWKGDGDDELCKALGITVAPPNTKELGVGTRQIASKLPAYGRAFYIPLIFSAYDGSKFGSLYGRGVGGGNPDVGDINTYPIIRTRDHAGKVEPRNAGLSDRNTTVAEMAVSKTLHDKGIRVRLPVAGFLVKEVVTGEGVKTVAELIEEKILNPDYAENPPVISVWARRNPTTFRDAYSTDNVDVLLHNQAQFLRLEPDEKSHEVARLIDWGRGETAWFEWLAEKSGQQMNLAAKVGFIHPAFHDQNMTLAIEAGDLGDDKCMFGPITAESEKSLRHMHCMNVMGMLDHIVRLKETFNSKKDSNFNYAKGLNKITWDYFRSLFKTGESAFLIDDLIEVNRESYSVNGMTNMQSTIERVLRVYKTIFALRDRLKKLNPAYKRSGILTKEVLSN